MTNKILYKDFRPRVLETNFWGNSTFEPLEVVMERVNEWVRKNYNTEIINVETVVMNAVNSKVETASVNRVNYHGLAYQIQFVRVWYKK